MDVVVERERQLTDDLEGFVSAHYQRLLGLLVLRLGGQGPAEEVAHESLLKLVKHWDRVRLMENPWAWLAKVAVNQSRSRWRRQSVAERAERRLGPVNEADSPGDGITELLMVIGGLPERQRSALLLRHYAHLTVRETAEAMGCAEGTVKSLTSKAIARLQTDLSEGTPDAHD